jgi:hypothetical protein
MTLLEWAALCVAIIGILTAVYSSMRFVIKSIMRELLPNGGSSLRDDINKIQARLDTLYDLLLK